jgi:alginate O-acetyltransferase complex protein AlgI
MKPVVWAKIILPIGISFFTFETMTYVVDVYKGISKPFRRFWDYQLYIILFPKLIAGPIIPYHDFADQVDTHTELETSENKLRGFYRFCIGLGKKVMIANVMGATADHIFNLPENSLDTTTAWVGALSYTFQIYFDFSGYSDMAIGMGQMMGFKFPENFNNPYAALSVTDFWRKWHITLGNWMRTYLYIPLGGNRVNSKLRLLFNLWIVFLASGLWHGAAWGFVIWGAYHGIFLVIERLFLAKWLARLGKAACIYTFIVVLIGWVFFRAEQLPHSLYYLNSMFSWNPGSDRWLPGTEYICILLAAIIFSFFTLPRIGMRIQQKLFYGDYSIKAYYLMTFLSIVLFFICAGRITTSSSNAFLYFRF